LDIRERIDLVTPKLAWADGSSWNKVIPILEKAGHRVIAVQLPLHTLADDVDTVKRAIDLVAGPVTLVGHSDGGLVITNAASSNPKVTGLVYLASFAPNEGQSLSNFIDLSKLPNDLLIFDNGGFAYINPTMFQGAFAQDINLAEAAIMAAVQEPINQSVLGEKSGPRRGNNCQLGIKFSEGDHMIPPDAERLFAKQMNATATTLSINSSHASPVSHPNETAQLILNATKGSNGLYNRPVLPK
jgi:pimeloyl-ACP methyl ester carboxylesterase